MTALEIVAFVIVTAVPNVTARPVNTTWVAVTAPVFAMKVPTAEPVSVADTGTWKPTPPHLAPPERLMADAAPDMMNVSVNRRMCVPLPVKVRVPPFRLDAACGTQ